MVDEGMAHDVSTEGQIEPPSPLGPLGESGPEEPEEILYEARLELDHTSDELEQLTAELNERTEQAARLELIMDALLEVMSSAAVVVDAENQLVAVSRAATAEYPVLADRLGQVASNALPRPLVQALGAFELEREAGDVQHHEDGPVRSVVALSDGSVLLVLRTASRH